MPPQFELVIACERNRSNIFERFSSDFREISTRFCCWFWCWFDLTLGARDLPNRRAVKGHILVQLWRSFSPRNCSFAWCEQTHCPSALFCEDPSLRATARLPGASRLTDLLHYYGANQAWITTTDQCCFLFDSTWLPELFQSLLHIYIHIYLSIYTYIYI